jgi:acyl-CoA hydrolase
MIASGRLDLIEVTQSHDLSAVSSIERFVAVNTAVQVGLDGSVNVESAGGRVVAGPGGHPDFALAASCSPGGMSLVAVASTAGGRSTIVCKPDVVSTPRSDVDVVVTEYGVADLRACSDSERAARLIAIAHPDHRDTLLGGASRTP